MATKKISPEIKDFADKLQVFFRQNIASGTYIIHEHLKGDYDFLLYIISSKPGRWDPYIFDNVRYVLKCGLESNVKNIKIPDYLRRKIIQDKTPFIHTGINIVEMFKKNENLKAFCKQWFEENYYKKEK